MVLVPGSDEQYAQVALIAFEGDQLVKSTWHFKHVHLFQSDLAFVIFGVGSLTWISNDPWPLSPFSRPAATSGQEVPSDREGD